MANRPSILAPTLRANQTYTLRRIIKGPLRSPPAPVRFLLHKKPLRPWTPPLNYSPSRMDGLRAKGREQVKIVGKGASFVKKMLARSAAYSVFKRGSASRSGAQQSRAW
jgi:hypothetical protein